MTVESVRNKMVNGSRTSRVRLPSKAATRITNRAPYLAFRQFSGGELFKVCEFLKENKSRIVPIGHSHPHQARPKTRVRMTKNKNKEEPARIVRLASIWASIVRGLRRKGKFTRLPDQPPRLVMTNKTINPTSALAWTPIRTNLQG